MAPGFLAGVNTTAVNNAAIDTPWVGGATANCVVTLGRNVAFG